jgi:hypothetical protein
MAMVEPEGLPAMLADFAGRAICNSGMCLWFAQRGPVFAFCFMRSSAAAAVAKKATDSSNKNAFG